MLSNTWQYGRGQPMPDFSDCIFMQSCTTRTSRNRLLRFINRILPDSYCKVVLTEDLVLCVSNGADNDIKFAVDLKKDDYEYESSTNTLVLPSKSEDLHFREVTGHFIQETISEYLDEFYHIVSYLFPLNSIKTYAHAILFV